MKSIANSQFSGSLIEDLIRSTGESINAAKLTLAEVFSDDDIRRGDLPADAFQLIHDLAYDHEGRERTQYKIRAQAILKRPSGSVR